jgi:hypothetical protein
MLIFKRPLSALLAIALVMAFVGCETSGQSAALGAGLGAAAGGLIGSRSGEAAEGALIGAAAGAITGLAAHDIRSNVVRRREETAQRYNYNPSQGELLQLESAQVLPSVVEPGQMIEASIQYALLGTRAGKQNVVETRQLFRGDQLVAELSSKTLERTDGTWVSAAQIRIPQGLTPGVYTLVQRVQTPQSTISGSTQFTVR